MNELRLLADELDLEYEENEETFTFCLTKNIELICKPKEKWTIVYKMRNGKTKNRFCFYNNDKLKSYICCQYALECFQLA
jgi:hypothetical protein